jgi:hypothetical protein
MALVKVGKYMVYLEIYENVTTDVTEAGIAEEDDRVDYETLLHSAVDKLVEYYEAEEVPVTPPSLAPAPAPAKESAPPQTISHPSAPEPWVHGWEHRPI